MTKRIVSDFSIGSILPGGSKAPCSYLGTGVKHQRRSTPAIFNTPLEEWIDVPRSVGNLEVYLSHKIKAAKKPVNILDIGIGSGSQWLDFAKKHGFEIGVNFNIYGNDLGKRHVHPDLRSFVKSCPASKVHKFFEKGSMDFVVSHSGMHGEALAGLENAIHLAKPGGEVIVSAHEFESKDVDFENPHFEVISKRENEEHPGKIYGLHLRKK